MTDVDASALPELFGRYAERFAAEKQALIELDGKVGDSDLGLTMAKGFAAADAALAEAAPDSLSAGDICRQFQRRIVKNNSNDPSCTTVCFARLPSVGLGSRSAGKFDHLFRLSA